MRTPSTGKFHPVNDAKAELGGAEQADTGDKPRTSWQTRQNVEGKPSPRTPTERDESSDTEPGQPGDVMDKAHADASRGRPPTDRSEATNATYGDNLRSPTPGAERDAGGGPGHR